jgi:hypothetical protein
MQVSHNLTHARMALCNELRGVDAFSFYHKTAMELASKPLCIFIQTVDNNERKFSHVSIVPKKVVYNKYERNMKYIEASEK